MNEDTLNMSVRKFLKRVGVTSQREIESAVASAIEAGELKGNEQLKIRMTLSVDTLDLTHIVDDEISLE